LNPRNFGGSTHYPVILCGESRLLVSWCASDLCDMAGSDEDHGRSRRPGAEDRGWSSIGRVLGGQTIERSDDVVCGLYRAQRNEEREFLGLASKPRLTFVSGSASKPLGRIFRFGPQNQQLKFGDLSLKITTTISLFVPQNQADYGLSVTPQN
jgi:hypothetical protein